MPQSGSEVVKECFLFNALGDKEIEIVVMAMKETKVPDAPILARDLLLIVIREQACSSRVRATFHTGCLLHLRFLWY